MNNVNVSVEIVVRDGAQRRRLKRNADATPDLLVSEAPDYTIKTNKKIAYLKEPYAELVTGTLTLSNAVPPHLPMQVLHVAGQILSVVGWLTRFIKTSRTKLVVKSGGTTMSAENATPKQFTALIQAGKRIELAKAKARRRAIRAKRK